MSEFYGTAANDLLSLGANAGDLLYGLGGNDTLVAGGGNNQGLEDEGRRQPGRNGHWSDAIRVSLSVRSAKSF